MLPKRGEPTTVAELRAECKRRGLRKYSKLKKDELVRMLQGRHDSLVYFTSLPSAADLYCIRFPLSHFSSLSGAMYNRVGRQRIGRVPEMRCNSDAVDRMGSAGIVGTRCRQKNYYPVEYLLSTGTLMFMVNAAFRYEVEDIVSTTPSPWPFLARYSSWNRNKLAVTSEL